MKRRTVYLLAAMYLLLAVAAFQSWSYMSDRRQSALAAQEDAIRCRELAQSIEQLNRRPALAAEHEQGEAQVTSQIEKAAETAGISPKEGVASIRPDAEAHRVGDTVYKEKPTQVSLHKVTLEQLVRMSHALLNSSSQLHIKSINLSAPRDDMDAKTWSVELTLTYLIYNPVPNRK